MTFVLGERPSEIKTKDGNKEFENVRRRGRRRSAEACSDRDYRFLWLDRFLNFEKPIGPHEFARAVKISTGETLSMNLVNTVYAIFDKDGDQKLSHKEFIGVMSDRFARQQKVSFNFNRAI